MKITHFTHPNAYALICTDGQVNLEGCNAHRGWDSMSREQRRLIYKNIGRHVWFTQAKSAKSASSNDIALTFNSEDIGAVRWTDYKKRFKNSKSKWFMVECFEESAIGLGDNPNDYWLTDKPVSLSKLIKEAAE